MAYSAWGAGPALLCDSGWITDLRGQLELFAFREFVEGLAGRFTVIRYDKPGCGLSDRGGAGLSLDGQVAAALAVAPRTAEAHVENIRRKLGVRSRAQIAAWVTEHWLRARAAR